jgi:ribonuclease D
MCSADAVLLAAATEVPALPDYPGLSLPELSLVTDAVGVEYACRLLTEAATVGFDTESRPTFVKGETATGPHLVQLATDAHAYLFPIRDGLLPAPLRKLLESQQVQKVGFGLANDRNALKKRLQLHLENVVDLGLVLRAPGCHNVVGARAAVVAYFGQNFRKSKKTGTSNWASPRLSERQLLYAANDAHVALRIYQRWLACRLPVSV